MNNFDIETTFKKIDKHFVEDLSSQQRIKAIKQFKRVYANQMAKLAIQVEKRMKVQANLDQINQKAFNEVKQIDEELKKKMEKHNQNREKQQSSKLKEHKMIQQNWKRRLDEIVRKKRQKQKQAYHKAEKIRKQAEQFWIKKSETVNFREDGSRITQNHQTYIGLNSNSRSLGRDRSSQTVYLNKNKNLLPSLTKTKIKRNNIEDTKLLNQSIDQKSLNEQIRIHKQKCIKTCKQQEQQNFQKIMGKLDKIQQTRKSVHERLERETKQAKRLRELRQNPEQLAANKRKNFQQMNIKMKSKGKPHHSKAELSNSHSGSKYNLNDSISNRLQKSKRLKEAEFQKREEVFQQKMKKIKNSKINRMVREAVNLIKHKALSNETE